MAQTNSFRSQSLMSSRRSLWRAIRSPCFQIHQRSTKRHAENCAELSLAETVFVLPATREDCAANAFGDN
jgi:hypothetical protein